MRLLKHSAFLLTTLALAVSSFAAQSAPQSKKEQPSIQSPTGKSAAAKKQPSAVTPRALDSVQMIQPPKMVQPPNMIQRPNFDQGIYLPTYADGQSTCAAIMSYNFTPGENPQLKDVTTCTSARPNSVYRTDDERKKRPPAVELQMISVPQRSGVH
jgi:hypothetical protein